MASEITIISKGQTITGIIVEGHVGFEHDKPDIVCSSLSTASWILYKGLTKAVVDERELLATEEDGLYFFKISQHAANEVTKVLFETYIDYIEGLNELYPKFISMRYESED